MNKTTCKNYSVLLLYPSYLADQETVYSFVACASAEEAIKEAQREAASTNNLPSGNAGDFWALLVTEGHHLDAREAP